MLSRVCPLSHHDKRLNSVRATVTCKTTTSTANVRRAPVSAGRAHEPAQGHKLVERRMDPKVATCSSDLKAKRATEVWQS
eukprot:3498147-Amphidinium_carterae.1